MLTYLLSFCLFLIAVSAMAVGVIFAGKRLSGSCGGVSPDGDELGDCVCSRKDQELCPSEDETGLLGMAEMGYPKRVLKEPHRDAGPDSEPEPPLSV
ncbi:MAG: hypothetical protein QGH51_08635 [Planctomycetota bacterium]|jgi:hypothetical protein|nr:hypothetical protein [Planctomycetota bacterium]